jgi:hypothetical protein
MMQRRFRLAVRVYLFVLGVTFGTILIATNSTPPGRYDSLLVIAGVSFASLIAVGFVAMVLVSVFKGHLVAVSSAGVMLVLMVGLVATTPTYLGVIWAVLGPMFLLLIAIPLLVGAVRRGEPSSRWDRWTGGTARPE